MDLSGLADPVDWLVFGMKPGQSNDKFKLKSLSVSLPPPPPPPPPPHQAPEEGVLALLGAGAFFLATRRRRLEASPHQGGL